MTAELGHEALAERHDLVVALALGVKVGTALAAADRQAGQGILEDLLKTEELDDSDVYGRVKADAALIGTDRGIELHAVAGVYLNLSVVVYPRNTELDLTLRLAKTLQKCELFILFFVDRDHRAKRVQHFLHSL